MIGLMIFNLNNSVILYFYEAMMATGPIVGRIGKGESKVTRNPKLWYM